VEKIIPVEIKAATELSDINIAQAKNYLEAGGIEIGLLINFGAPSLQFKRMINNKVLFYLLKHHDITTQAFFLLLVHLYRFHHMKFGELWLV